MALSRVVVVVVLLVFRAVHAEGQAIIFPDQVKSEGQRCSTRRVTSGTCQRSCQDPTSHTATNWCGTQDSTHLFCCDVRKPDRSTDISPPFVNFQCGRNFKFFLNNQGNLGPTPQPVPQPQPRPVPRPALPPRPASDQGHGNLPGSPFPSFPSSPDDFIHAAVGGVDAEENAWPWMALLGKRDVQGITWFCAGVLINDQWVLSAGHCFLHQNTDVVRLGEHDYNNLHEGAAHQDFGVANTVLYPGYTPPQAYHDLALLRLDATVNIQRFISPVCLPWGQESNNVLTGQGVTLTGWGDTEFGGFPSSILQEVNVTVFSSSQCDRSYSSLTSYATTWPQGIGQETLCAGDPNGGRDACQGDSGGPLVSHDGRGLYVLAGIVSRGHGCGHKDYPGLYANLRHPPYLAWIKQVAFTLL